MPGGLHRSDSLQQLGNVDRFIKNSQIQILLRYGLSDVTGVAVNQDAILCQNIDS
jgi:hypothetical protein